MNESRFSLPVQYQQDPTFMAIYNKIVAIQEAVHADYFKRFGLRLGMDVKLRMQEQIAIQAAAGPYYNLLSNYITTGGALTISQAELA